MGRMSCPGRESDCLKSAETEVGISARIYDSNWAREGPGSERRHAGTVEGISARIHVANSRGDRAEETRRSDRTVQIHCGRGTTLACRGQHRLSIEEWGVQPKLEDDFKQELRRERTASVGVTPLNCTLGRYIPMGFLPRVNQAASCSRARERPNRPRN